MLIVSVFLMAALMRVAQGASRMLVRPLAAAPAVVTSYRSLASMPAEAFKKHEVIPDVLKTAPSKTAKAVYEGGVEASLGNVLTPTQVKSPPKLTWDTEPGALYTVILTDPDAPSRKEATYREWHHWLIINVPGNDIDKGDVLAEYIGAGPPKGTGLHRYIFLVYKQPGKITDSEHGHLTNRSGDGRGGFKTAKFVEKHKLGNPIAGNFFQAEWDDYVPTLYKQLEG